MVEVDGVWRTWWSPRQLLCLPLCRTINSLLGRYLSQRHQGLLTSDLFTSGNLRTSAQVSPTRYGQLLPTCQPHLLQTVFGNPPSPRSYLGSYTLLLASKSAPTASAATRPSNAMHSDCAETRDKAGKSARAAEERDNISTMTIEPRGTRSNREEQSGWENYFPRSYPTWRSFKTGENPMIYIFIVYKKE